MENLNPDFRSANGLDDVFIFKILSPKEPLPSPPETFNNTKQNIEYDKPDLTETHSFSDTHLEQLEQESNEYPRHVRSISQKDPSVLNFNSIKNGEYDLNDNFSKNLVSPVQSHPNVQPASKLLTKRESKNINNRFSKSRFFEETQELSNLDNIMDIFNDTYGKNSISINQDIQQLQEIFKVYCNGLKELVDSKSKAASLFLKYNYKNSYSGNFSGITNNDAYSYNLDAIKEDNYEISKLMNRIQDLEAENNLLENRLDFFFKNIKNSVENLKKVFIQTNLVLDGKLQSFN